MTAFEKRGDIYVPVGDIHVKVAGVIVPVRRGFARTGGAWKKFYNDEVVVTLGNSSAPISLKSLFAPAEWSDPLINKRVVIPEGVTIGTNFVGYAVYVAPTSDGQAGSFGGDLIVDNYGIMAGIGGTPNSGVGGSVIYANLPGKDGRKMIVINRSTGIIRAGGGGGGKAGNGGSGSYQSPYTYREPTSGEAYSPGPQGRYWTHDSNSGNSVIQWDSISVQPGSSAGFTSYTYNGWTYWKGSLRSTDPSVFGIWRTQTRYNTVNTAGGVAGNAGRGQGFDGAATNGAAAVAGGTNAGASGKSGNGGAWGTAGQAGANGANGNVGSGTAGAAGGLAGFYLNGQANVDLTNEGTLLGRVQ